jgi:hypothetical protein
MENIVINFAKLSKYSEPIPKLDVHHITTKEAINSETKVTKDLILFGQTIVEIADVIKKGFTKKDAIVIGLTVKSIKLLEGSLNFF